MVICPRDWECRNYGKPTLRRESVPLLKLEPGVFKCQYILPQDIGTYLHWSCVGTTCQFNTYFFLLPLTQRLLLSRQNQNLYSTLLVKRYSFNSLYVGNNRAMCQWEEGKSVFYTDAVCAITCFVEFKDSMYALLAPNIKEKNRVIYYVMSM